MKIDRYFYIFYNFQIVINQFWYFYTWVKAAQPKQIVSARQEISRFTDLTVRLWYLFMWIAKTYRKYSVFKILKDWRGRQPIKCTALEPRVNLYFICIFIHFALEFWMEKLNNTLRNPFRGAKMFLWRTRWFIALRFHPVKKIPQITPRTNPSETVRKRMTRHRRANGCIIFQA